MPQGPEYSGLLGKRFPAPIWKPMWPFFAAGIIVTYGISSFANLLANSEEYRNDPRNPALKTRAPEKH